MLSGYGGAAYASTLMQKTFDANASEFLRRQMLKQEGKTTKGRTALHRLKQEPGMLWLPVGLLLRGLGLPRLPQMFLKSARRRP